MSEAQIKQTCYPETTLVMVKRTEQQALFTGVFLSGHVVSLEDATHYYKFFPMKYAWESTT